MDHEELIERFNKNVEYLQRNIPPDDIYAFAEQTFMAAVYFLSRWSNVQDLNQVVKEDSIAKKYVINILGFKKLKEKQVDVDLDLGLED